MTTATQTKTATDLLRLISNCESWIAVAAIEYKAAQAHLKQTNKYNPAAVAEAREAFEAADVKLSVKYDQLIELRNAYNSAVNN
jgi:hypothetical protein